MRLMLDLCAGLQGASAAMKERGWTVVTLDIDPSFGCDITADLLTWSWDGDRPDLIWISPPCNDFSREFMPWSRTGHPPDLSLYHAAIRIIKESRPRYWVIENVKGAIKYFGKYRKCIGPFYLWGYFPPVHIQKLDYRPKESMSSSWDAERAKIPYQISLAFALAIEQQPELMEAQR